MKWLKEMSCLFVHAIIKFYDFVCHAKKLTFLQTFYDEKSTLRFYWFLCIITQINAWMVSFKLTLPILLRAVAVGSKVCAQLKRRIIVWHVHVKMPMQSLCCHKNSQILFIKQKIRISTSRFYFGMEIRKSLKE